MPLYALYGTPSAARHPDAAERTTAASQANLGGARPGVPPGHDRQWPRGVPAVTARQLAVIVALARLTDDLSDPEREALGAAEAFLATVRDGQRIGTRAR